MTGNLSVKIGDGKKLEAPASNEVVETFGVTVAKVNDKFEIEEVKYMFLFFFLCKVCPHTSICSSRHFMTPVI